MLLCAAEDAAVKDSIFSAEARYIRKSVHSVQETESRCYASSKPVNYRTIHYRISPYDTIVCRPAIILPDVRPSLSHDRKILIHSAAIFYDAAIIFADTF
jgi:hypothetical protein